MCHRRVALVRPTCGRTRMRGRLTPRVDRKASEHSMGGPFWICPVRVRARRRRVPAETAWSVRARARGRHRWRSAIRSRTAARVSAAHQATDGTGPTVSVYDPSARSGGSARAAPVRTEKNDAHRKPRYEVLRKSLMRMSLSRARRSKSSEAALLLVPRGFRA